MAFALRCRSFGLYVLNMPVLGAFLLPKSSKAVGMGWLICEADRQVTRRETQIVEKPFDSPQDFLQQYVCSLSFFLIAIRC